MLQWLPGDLPSALRDYSSVLVIDPDHLEALVHRGTVNEKLGSLDAAIVDFTRGASQKSSVKDPDELGIGVICIQELQEIQHACVVDHKYPLAPQSEGTHQELADSRTPKFDRQLR